MPARLNVIALILSILMLTACSQNSEQQRLRECVEQGAANCPIKIADGINITSITYSDNTVTYTVTSDNPLLSVATLKSQEALIKPTLIEAMKGSSDPKAQQEMDLIRAAKANLKVVITDRSGSLEMDFTPDQL